jgi:hypothetical protein
MEPQTKELTGLHGLGNRYELHTLLYYSSSKGCLTNNGKVARLLCLLSLPPLGFQWTSEFKGSCVCSRTGEANEQAPQLKYCLKIGF